MFDKAKLSDRQLLHCIEGMGNNFTYFFLLPAIIAFLLGSQFKLQKTIKRVSYLNDIYSLSAL